MWDISHAGLYRYLKCGQQNSGNKGIVIGSELPNLYNYIAGIWINGHWINFDLP